MANSICGANCAECPSGDKCPGCAETRGCPFGKQCFVAEYILSRGMEAWISFKTELMDEVNALGIPGMGKVSELFPMVGAFVNLEYPLPNGEAVKFLSDDEMYLGAQVENGREDEKGRCFGIIARESFLLVCEYGENCSDPKIVVYKRR